MGLSIRRRATLAALATASAALVLTLATSPALAGSWAPAEGSAPSSTPQAPHHTPVHPRPHHGAVPDCGTGHVVWDGPVALCVPAQTPSSAGPDYPGCWYGLSSPPNPPHCSGDGGGQPVVLDFSAQASPTWGGGGVIVLSAAAVNPRGAATTIPYGGHANLVWHTRRASRCALSGGRFGAAPGQGVATNGSESTGPLRESTTYTLRCSGAQPPQAVATATVRVGSQPTPTMPPGSFTVSASSVFILRRCTARNGRLDCIEEQARPPMTRANGFPPVVTWHAKDAESCTVSVTRTKNGQTLSSGVVGHGASGSHTIPMIRATNSVPPFPNTGINKWVWSFSARCTGPGGSATFDGPSFAESLRTFKAF